MFQIQRQKRRQKLIWIAVVVGVILAILIAAGAAYYIHQRQEKKKLEQVFTPNPQTELGNESKDDENATNTSEQNRVLTEAEKNQVQSTTTANPSLPTPLLTKSSGNNGSVPVGAALEFTCTAPAGYDCAIRISGSKTINLDKKKLTDNGRGQAVVLWNWPAQAGTWSVAAILSNSTGEKSSAVQTLEVK